MCKNEKNIAFIVIRFFYFSSVCYAEFDSISTSKNGNGSSYDGNFILYSQVGDISNQTNIYEWESYGTTFQYKDVKKKYETNTKNEQDYLNNKINAYFLDENGKVDVSERGEYHFSDFDLTHSDKRTFNNIVNNLLDSFSLVAEASSFSDQYIEFCANHAPSECNEWGFPKCHYFPERGCTDGFLNGFGGGSSGGGGAGREWGDSDFDELDQKIIVLTSDMSTFFMEAQGHFTNIYKRLDDLDGLGEQVGSIGDSIGGGFGQMTGSLFNIYGMVNQDINGLKNAIYEVGSDLYSPLRTISSIMEYAVLDKMNETLDYLADIKALLVTSNGKEVFDFQKIVNEIKNFKTVFEAFTVLDLVNQGQVEDLLDKLALEKTQLSVLESIKKINNIEVEKLLKTQNEILNDISSKTNSEVERLLSLQYNITNQLLSEIGNMNYKITDISNKLSNILDNLDKQTGTTFWDFLGGLFGDIFDFVEFLIEKIIYLVIPEDVNFINDAFANLRSALDTKFEPVGMLKTQMLGSLMVEQQNFEDIEMNLPIYGHVKFLDVEFLNYAIPKIRSLLSGIMLIITAFWAYRKINSGMIK